MFQVLVQNGGTGRDLSGEVTGAANIFAHLGLTLNLRPPTTNGAINSSADRVEQNHKQNNEMHLSKEHVVEVKEEDERRTSLEVCILCELLENITLFVGFIFLKFNFITNSSLSFSGM